MGKTRRPQVGDIWEGRFGRTYLLIEEEFNKGLNTHIMWCKCLNSDRIINELVVTIRQVWRYVC